MIYTILLITIFCACKLEQFSDLVYAGVYSNNLNWLLNTLKMKDFFLLIDKLSLNIALDLCCMAISIVTKYAR